MAGRVFITGLGLITSIGNDVPSVTAALRELRHGIQLYPPFAGDDVPVKVAAPVRGFDTASNDPEDWTYPDAYRIRREVIRGMAPHGLYAWCAMQQAITDAGLGEADFANNPDTGLYAASGGSPQLMGYMLGRMHQLGVMRCSPLGIVAAISGTLNFNLVAHFKIKGASCGFSSACASSAHALGYAYDDLVLGRAKRMFVVGAEDGNVDSILPFAGMRALSLQRDPALASRPFDAARDGFVGTGGAAVLVLETEDEVQRRGAPVYGEVAAWGQASDGHNVAISHPEGEGLALAMRRALQAAQLAPGDVDYINAHATSTPIGDLSEVRAIKSVFAGSGEEGGAGGRSPASPAISSTKALTGHGLSLAGAMESAFCALALREGFLPGSAHIAQLDPECAGLRILRKTVAEPPRVVLNNSSGFGGANVSVVLKRA
ncbi:beta-ketoacyl synthase [Cephaloticoccus primus]|uniref:3-oxoacyl-[acyl-carrier-protein] synthase 1 n=1 Tax=Cephaloticoccus primus TaxID=1548207 RepID=A0A139ST34_9BACT|nr:beta-ketoacyl-[acyl-carrier-protein] synthase family protein [Cephaloticoccus primus]KXU37739.1 beta-ketoacyl synthase [Cephaloticoccus primus]